MTSEETIKQQIITQFSDLTDKLRIQRPRRLWLEVPLSQFRTVLDFLIQPVGFTVLHTITGLDNGADFGLIYHLGQNGVHVLNVKTTLPKDNPVINSLIDIFPNAEIYERELVDLFGIQVTGLPDGNRYPLTDDWPVGQFPLRKDWTGQSGPTGEEPKTNA